MKQGIMLDLETMSSRPNAAVISIGAVVFDYHLPWLLHEEFYAVLEQKEQQDQYDRHVSASTFTWWCNQSAEARAVLQAYNDVPVQAESITLVLLRFSEYARRQRPSLDGVWGNGSDFDNVILHGLYNAVGIACPWRYSQSRCYRTLKTLLPDCPLPQRGEDEPAHHALGDAKYQARCAQALLRSLQPETEGERV
jgi:hypothetical protein